jgi:hypothetical protein
VKSPSVRDALIGDSARIEVVEVVEVIEVIEER